MGRKRPWKLVLWGLKMGLVALAFSMCWMSVPRGGSKLEVVFLGYTNTASRPAHALLSMKNKSEELLYVMRGVTVEFLPEGGHTSWNEIEVTNFWLAPHTSRVFSIPAPTNGPVWRAEASFVGQRQIDNKANLNKKVRHYDWIRKHMAWYLQLTPEHARTRWVARSTKESQLNNRQVPPPRE